MDLLNRGNSLLYFRKMKARLGKAEGVVADAHKLIRVIYGMIKTRKKYNETEAFKISPQSSARHRRKLEKQAEKLGLQLVAYNTKRFA